MVAIATMITQRWMNPDLFTTLMILLPIPLLIVAERVWTKREDWLLTPKEFAEDAFWLGFAALLWIPLYDDVYQTPLSEAFTWLRDRSPLEVTLAPTTVLGLLGAVMLVKLVESFIYYWCHRIQHESLFFWRMHATHHHITKMGCLRGDRTHPLEYLTLALGTPIALALFGASEDVIAVTAAFHFWNGNLNHANLPLRSCPAMTGSSRPRPSTTRTMRWSFARVIPTTAATSSFGTGFSAPTAATRPLDKLAPERARRFPFESSWP